MSTTNEGHPGRRVVDNWERKSNVPVSLTTSAAVVFTATKRTVITELRAANSSGGAVIATLYKGAGTVAAPFTAGATNFFSNKSVGANDEYNFVNNGEMVLEKGQQLQAKAGSGSNAVLLTISYKTEV